MSKFGSVSQRIIEESHNTPYSRHPKQGKMRALIEAIYFMTCMQDNVEYYMKTFLVFQQNKVEKR